MKALEEDQTPEEQAWLQEWNQMVRNAKGNKLPPPALKPKTKATL